MLVCFAFHHKCIPRVILQKLYIAFLKNGKNLDTPADFGSHEVFKVSESEAVPMSLDVL